MSFLVLLLLAIFPSAPQAGSQPASSEAGASQGSQVTRDAFDPKTATRAYL